MLHYLKKNERKKEKKMSLVVCGELIIAAQLRLINSQHVPLKLWQDHAVLLSSPSGKYPMAVN